MYRGTGRNRSERGFGLKCRRHGIFIARGRPIDFLEPIYGRQNVALLRSAYILGGSWFYKYFAAMRLFENCAAGTIPCASANRRAIRQFVNVASRRLRRLRQAGSCLKCLGTPCLIAPRVSLFLLSPFMGDRTSRSKGAKIFVATFGSINISLLRG